MKNAQRWAQYDVTSIIDITKNEERSQHRPVSIPVVHTPVQPGGASSARTWRHALSPVVDHPVGMSRGTPAIRSFVFVLLGRFTLQKSDVELECRRWCV
jgi:hypothetical protein